jgi:pyruvate/2-oxoglutarate dehydrogenase complex dihydrolipoamide acyltransferase (E2) component
VTKKTKIQGWRKIAAATWGRPSDPQIYGDMEIDATALLEFIDDARAATGVPLTITHLVGKAIAYSLAENIDLNVKLRGRHFVSRDGVSVFFIVSADKGNELSGVKIDAADEKPVVEIARELAERAARIRSGDDIELGKTKKVIGSTPVRLLGLSTRIAAWLTTDLGLDLKRFGLPREPFGSAMVSSVGMFGIQHAYAPLSPYYRFPFLVLVGEVVPKPVVVGDGQIEARPMVTLSATMDHRYLDGFHAARLAGSAREYLGDPKRFEPPLVG